jgi:hypothetical protein
MCCDFSSQTTFFSKMRTDTTQILWTRRKMQYVALLLVLLGASCSCGSLSESKSASILGPVWRQGKSCRILQSYHHLRSAALRGGNDLSPELTSRLKALIGNDGIMLFMKGTPTHPQCGFSSKIVEILKENQIEYGSFNSKSPHLFSIDGKNVNTYTQRFVTFVSFLAEQFSRTKKFDRD